MQQSTTQYTWNQKFQDLNHINMPFTFEKAYLGRLNRRSSKQSGTYTKQSKLIEKKLEQANKTQGDQQHNYFIEKYLTYFSNLEKILLYKSKNKNLFQL